MGDLSFLSAVLNWGRHSRRLDLPERLALDARASMVHEGLNTRSVEREREPTADELTRLFAHWAARPRPRIPMPLLCRFALATGMRQGEICRLDVADIDRGARTVIIRNRKDPGLKVTERYASRDERTDAAVRLLQMNKSPIPAWAMKVLVIVAIPAIACTGLYALDATEDASSLRSTIRILTFPALLMAGIGLYRSLATNARRRGTRLAWALYVAISAAVMIASRG